MKFAVNPSQMNLTQYIIYPGTIMNICWGLWSVCSEAAAIALLSWCALMFTVLGECNHEKAESGFCWALPHAPPGQRPRLLVRASPQRALQGALRKQYPSLPSCQAAIHPLLDLLENKGLWWNKITNRIHFYTLSWQPMPANQRKAVSFWLQNM